MTPSITEPETSSPLSAPTAVPDTMSRFGPVQIKQQPLSPIGTSSSNNNVVGRLGLSPTPYAAPVLLGAATSVVNSSGTSNAVPAVSCSAGGVGRASATYSVQHTLTATGARCRSRNNSSGTNSGSTLPSSSSTTGVCSTGGPLKGPPTSAGKLF
jgi:hypothetical protein